MTLQNGFATHFQASPLISMRTESLASSQSGRSIDADAWCKQALTGPQKIWEETVTLQLHQGPLSDWKTRENGESIFQSGNFEQTGKVRENHTKYWKNIREFQKKLCYFLVIFK